MSDKELVEYFNGILPIFLDETINAQAVVKGNSIKIRCEGYFGIWYKATSVIGAPDIKIEIQESYNNIDENFAEPEDVSDIVTNLVNENPHVKEVSIPPMNYMRFVVTGNAANPADTKLTMYLFAQ